MDKQLLTRELLQSGAVDEMAARAAPGIRLLTPDQRAASLRATLAARPPGDVWLFAYGSLIWNPTIEAAERRPARIAGWHRAFCLSVMMGRGTVENPGLVLGLDEGGDCHGVAFRIADDLVETELAVLWQREMLSGAYIPRWLDLLDADGARFGGAIAFTIDRTGQNYAGGLAESEVVRRLATATGMLGSSAEYLFQTCDGLRAHGMADDALDSLAASVRAVTGGDASGDDRGCP
jgi:cation transport protein ChaC